MHPTSNRQPAAATKLEKAAHLPAQRPHSGAGWRGVAPCIAPLHKLCRIVQLAVAAAPLLKHYAQLDFAVCPATAAAARIFAAAAAFTAALPPLAQLPEDGLWRQGRQRPLPRRLLLRHAAHQLTPLVMPHQVLPVCMQLPLLGGYVVRAHKHVFEAALLSALKAGGQGAAAAAGQYAGSVLLICQPHTHVCHGLDS